MKKPEIYKFCIDAFTPATLPMVRLAEYMLKVAALLGQEERVHFVRLAKGSAVLEQHVEPQAIQKVRERILQARRPNEAPEDLRRLRQEINEMLRTDNAIADLRRGSAKVIQFRGREEPLPERVGPISEHIELVGVLVRIGGKDETAHAIVQSPDGKTTSCVVTRPLARSMAPHLFGPPLRLSGTARWERSEEGRWEIKSARVDSYRVLREEELQDVVARLRSVEGSEWTRENDPLQALARLRGSDEGVH